ncbi:MAG TPA: aldehyde dehydrogenase family protein [Longimicrobiaceae bacterium]|nr:aldehyde dehydrogenase family protein [Longimicrobiaceae bacterium]
MAPTPPAALPLLLRSGHEMNDPCRYSWGTQNNPPDDVVAAWNYPVRLTLAPLVAAVAAGNTVVLRRSEKTPATGVVLARVVVDAFREDEVALLGGGVEVADALLRLPFDHFFFTGSTAVGRRVMRAAAEHLASVTLELGGKSPAVVDASADVERAAERIAWGKFINGGQTCVAPDYVLVHESRAAELAEALRRGVEAFYGPTPEARRRSESFSRMIDDRAFSAGLGRAGRGAITAASGSVPSRTSGRCWCGAGSARRTCCTRPTRIGFAGSPRGWDGWWSEGLGLRVRACPSLALGVVRPQIIRSVVDLPAPFGPRKPVTVPGSQRNDTSSTASWEP